MVNIYKPKLTILQQEILRILFIKAGALLNQRQIANLLNVTPPAVMKALPELEKQGLIKSEQDKETKRWAISLNSENHKTTQLKRTDNLKQIYESGLADFIEEKISPKSIVLFGSYSRGEDDEQSDIDLFVECKKEELNLERFEKKLNRKIEVHFSNNFGLYSKELKNNIINGIVLKGFLEAIHDNKNTARQTKS